jgi:4a-hydroxytetrahydrobiopterin dehydratase
MSDPDTHGGPLEPEDVEQRLEQLAGWERAGQGIRKRYKFRSFPEAVAFVTRVAFLAEAANHHPDITINYNRVTLALITHSENALTEKDFNLATQIERLTAR